MYLQQDSNNANSASPVTHHNTYHNISSSVISTQSVETSSVTFNNVSCSTYYLVTVNAVNIVGEGDNTSITVCEFIIRLICIVFTNIYRC